MCYATNLLGVKYSSLSAATPAAPHRAAEQAKRAAEARAKAAKKTEEEKEAEEEAKRRAEERRLKKVAEEKVGGRGASGAERCGADRCSTAQRARCGWGPPAERQPAGCAQRCRRSPWGCQRPALWARASMGCSRAWVQTVRPSLIRPRPTNSSPLPLFSSQDKLRRMTPEQRARYEEKKRMKQYKSQFRVKAI